MMGRRLILRLDRWLWKHFPNPRRIGERFALGVQLLIGLLFLFLALAISVKAQTAAPVIQGYATACQPGCSITITGTGFGATQGSSFVSFNGLTATVTNWSDTSLSVTVPSNAQTGPLFITVGSVVSNKVNFTVTDEISQPLVNDGADPNVATGFSQLIKPTLVNAKAVAAQMALLSNQQSVDEAKEAADVAILNGKVAAIPIGPAGPQGPQGAQGIPGPAGASGSQGPAGQQGPMGPAGAVGPAGPAGAQGPIGPQGPQGAPGSALPNSEVMLVMPFGTSTSTFLLGGTQLEYPPGPRTRRTVDFTNVHQFRLCTNVAAPGGAGSFLQLQTSADQATWTALGSRMDVSSAKLQCLAWSDYAGALGDQFIRISGAGSGTLGIVFLSLQLR
jgi:Collagen triple helix repeat (20 copies)/IPT/TIG domain